jgi:hypothetical protein
MPTHAAREPVPRVLQVLLVAGGGGVTVWALAAAVREPGVVRSIDLPLVLVAAAALVAIGLQARRPARRSVSWAALGFVGYALALQLVDAGTAVLYQHLGPAVAPLSPFDRRILGGLAACALVVALGLTPRASALWAWIGRHLGPARAAFFILAWAAVSASPLKDLTGFALEIALATALAMTWAAALWLAVAALPEETAAYLSMRLDRAMRAADAARTDPIAIGAAVFATVVSASLALWVWERHPHLSDEISFLFQAQYFATGALTAPGVPVPELFAAYQIECNVDRCLSVLQPGWPWLLSLGVRAGVPWLVNPVLAGINALLLFAFVRELYGARLARAAVVLLAASPWHLFLAMSYMNHQATLAGGLLAVIGATWAVRRAPGWALLAGAGAGLTSLMRPMDGLIVAAVAGAPLLLMGSWARRAGAMVLFAVGTAVLGGLNLLYNRALTGDALDFPVTSYVNALWGEGTNNLGFGPDRGIYPMWAHMDGFPGHSPFQAVVNAALNVTALEVDLFGWATGSLVPVLLLIVWWRLRAADWLMLGWIAAINALYALYWFASGPDFAARYWFLAVVPLVVLTARGLEELGARLGGGDLARGRIAVVVAAGLLIAQGLLVFVPWRSADKYYRYFNNGPHVRAAIEDGSWPPGVYLVRGANQPDYAAALIYGGPALTLGNHVFAYDSLPNSADLLQAAFPETTIRLLDGPSITGDGYAVRALPDGPS